MTGRDHYASQSRRNDLRLEVPHSGSFRFLEMVEQHFFEGKLAIVVSKLVSLVDKLGFVKIRVGFHGLTE